MFNEQKLKKEQKFVEFKTIEEVNNYYHTEDYF